MSMNRRRCSLQLLSAAIYSRPYYPLGRSHPQRSFSSSNEPHSSAADSNSHHHGHTESPHHHHSSSHFNQNPNFRQYPPPPHQYQNQKFQSHPPPPLFRPKPPDYRTWEFAETPQPTTTDRFTVLSYNLLADYLALEHRATLYYHIPPYMLDWQWRKKNLVFELGHWSSDIMCFQEVDRFQDLEEELKCHGYKGLWKMRTGGPVDGCAILWRESRFNLVDEESIEFNKFELRNNVAQICVLELIKQNHGSSASPVPGSTEVNKVVVCNIHAFFNPKRGEIKLAQVKILLNRADAVSKNWNDAPVIICGDFNCVPKSPLYNYISEQKLDLSGIGRDMVSGQDSCELRSPRAYNPSHSFRSREDVVPTPSMVLYAEHDIQNESSVGTLKSDELASSLESVPAVESLSEPESADVLNAYKKSNIDAKDTEDESKLDKVKEETQRSFADNPNDGSRSACSVSGAEFREDLRLSQGEGGSFPSVASQPEEACSAAVGHTEEIYNSGPESFTDHVDNQSSRKTMSDDQGGFSGQSLANSTYIEVDERHNAYFNNFDGGVTEGETTAEDSATFLSALHEAEISFPSLPSRSRTFDSRHNSYELSSWVEIVTGSVDCTTLEHPLKLISSYTEAKDTLGIRDPSGEPLVTTHHKRFLGTVDYIWRSEGLQTVRVLAPIPKHVMQETSGFPTKKWGSDHIALATEFALVGQRKS